MAVMFEVQHADYSCEELGTFEKEEVLARITGHDWKGEINMMRNMTVSGKGTCPPGVFLRYRDKYLLHVWAEEEDAFELMIWVPQETTLLGFIPIVRAKEIRREAKSVSSFTEIIEAFIDCTPEELLMKLNQGGVL